MCVMCASACGLVSVKIFYKADSRSVRLLSLSLSLSLPPSLPPSLPLFLWLSLAMECRWTGGCGRTPLQNLLLPQPRSDSPRFHSLSPSCLRRDLRGHALVGKEDGGLVHLVHPVGELDKLLLDGFAVHDARLHPRHTHVAKRHRSRRDGTRRQKAKDGGPGGFVGHSACQFIDPNPDKCSILQRAGREIGGLQ